MVVMDVDRIAETVLLTTRPSYHQTSVYSLLEVDGHRRHKQEIQLLPTLKPVKYADTAFLLLNNSRRRFRSRTYYQPRMSPKLFADTTFASPKTAQERFVSSLDLHSDQLKKKFKTCIEIKPRNFKSSVSYPDVQSLSGHVTTNVFSHSSPSGGGGGGDHDDVDENMNRRIPVFREKYDPGASQVFIPKGKDLNYSSRGPVSSRDQDSLLDSISDQILVDYSGGDGGNKVGRMNGDGSRNDGRNNGFSYSNRYGVDLNGYGVTTSYSDL